MKKTKKIKNPNTRIETLHKTAQGLARIGALDKKTMRAFDTFCLTKVEVLSGEEIQALREREGVSQPGCAGASSQRRHQARERLGARHQTAERPIVEAARHCQGEGAGCDCVIAGVAKSSPNRR